jgi:hypothetical protein
MTDPAIRPTAQDMPDGTQRHKVAPCCVSGFSWLGAPLLSILSIGKTVAHRVSQPIARADANAHRRRGGGGAADTAKSDKASEASTGRRARCLLNA